MSDGNFEGLLHSMRRSKDGMVVSFVVQPNDVSNDLLTLEIGARVMIGWAECTDAPERTHVAKGEDAVVPPAASPRETKPKRTFKDMSLSEQSGIRANDWRFQDFLEHEYAGVWRNLKDAAASIREICGVQSRSELATDHNAANKWRVLNSKFESWLSDRLYSESVRR